MANGAARCRRCCCRPNTLQALCVLIHSSSSLFVLLLRTPLTSPLLLLSSLFFLPDSESALSSSPPSISLAVGSIFLTSPLRFFHFPSLPSPRTPTQPPPLLHLDLFKLFHFSHSLPLLHPPFNSSHHPFPFPSDCSSVISPRQPPFVGTLHVSLLSRLFFLSFPGLHRAHSLPSARAL